MTRAALALLVLLTPACGWSAPTDTVAIHGPADAGIEAAVDVWASEGAAVVVGQLGPCDGAHMSTCRADLPGEIWRVVRVQDGTTDDQGAVICDPKTESKVYASTSYAEHVIRIGSCMPDVTAVVAHEIGHILLGDAHDSDGVMVADEPTTIAPSQKTLARACTLGWGC